MYSTPGAWRRPKPHRPPRAPHQVCPEMREGFYTHNRIREELEVSPLDRQINQWPRQASQTTLWERLGDHRQRLEQEVLLC